MPGDDELWMTCEQCEKSDHFWLDEGVHCRCGARYGFAVRPDGSQVPAAELAFVPFKQGPMVLADLEWSTVRIMLLLLGMGALVALGAWLVRG